MTLANYLATPQAREDVGRLLADSPARDATLAGGRIWRKPEGNAFHSVSGLEVETLLTLKPREAWQLVRISQRDARLMGAMVPKISAYYRPDGDRYVVTDMGEGVRALRLRTGYSQYLAMECSDPMREALRTSGIGNVWSTERGIMELDNITAIDLPDAICRVMLASLRVAGVGLTTNEGSAHAKG